MNKNTLNQEKQSKIFILTLGCPKNEVDSDVLKGQLINGGLALVDEAASADTVLINTCGFIQDAKEESIHAILEAVSLKQDKPDLKVYVWGCLSQRYKGEIETEIPEVDGFFGVEPFEDLGRFLMGSQYKWKGSGFKKRSLSTPSHTAYVKIADGCDHLCSFCAIPLIRGNFRSRKESEIVDECRVLVEKGVKEIHLVAQDTTAYGRDLNNNESLVSILEKIADINGLQWIRILYGHPAHISDALIDTIADNEKVCHYLDMPLQHSHPEMLRKMGRRTTRERIEDIINRLRKRVPKMILRTSFIVGFPGEKETYFDDLLLFVKDVQFDRLGAFIFSPEEGTAAFGMNDPVPALVSQKRYDKLMEIQQAISIKKNNALVQKEITVLVDGYDSETGLYYGRSEGDALDVDQQVWIDGHVSISALNCVKIMSSSAYDLKGIPIYKEN